MYYIPREPQKTSLKFVLGVSWPVREQQPFKLHSFSTKEENFLWFGIPSLHYTQRNKWKLWTISYDKLEQLCQNLSCLSWQAAAATAAKSLQSCPTLCNPIDGSPPGSLSLGFSRQEHWSGLPFPSPMHESEKWKVKIEVTQSCPTLSDPMDCSLPGSSVHGIFQARVQEWGAIAFSVPDRLRAIFISPTALIT